MTVILMVGRNANSAQQIAAGSLRFKFITNIWIKLTYLSFSVPNMEAKNSAILKTRELKF